MEVEKELLLLKEKLLTEATKRKMSPSIPQEGYLEFSFPYLDVDMDLKRRTCDIRVYANKDAVPLSVYTYKDRKSEKRLQSYAAMQHKIIDAYFGGGLVAHIKPYSSLRGILKGEETRILFFNPGEQPQYIDVETQKPLVIEDPEHIHVLSPDTK